MMHKEFRNQLVTALHSSPIVYIPHFDYDYVDDVLCEILHTSDIRKLVPCTTSDILEYDISRGVVDFESKVTDTNLAEYSDITTFFKDILDDVSIIDRKILLLKNFSEPLHDAKIQVFLHTYASKWKHKYYNPLTTIIIASTDPVNTLPTTVERIFTIIDIKAPGFYEIREIVQKYSVSATKTTEAKKEALINDICRNLLGLQMFEIRQILSSAIVRTGGYLSDKTLYLVQEEKKQVVRKSGIIEVVDANESFEDIGGLDCIKRELETKATIFRHLREAQELRMTLPKGVLIIGMPGCGKSMIAKAIANEFNVSLLRLDLSRLMGQYVGQSEANLRRALATAEAAHPCVLWIDEIEKAFAGSTGKGGDDMLVTRLMGHFLTWMQERKTPVYIVATANDVMRPEFMRKGRFDEVYFVNFPSQEERAQILMKKLLKFRHRKDFFDFSEIKFMSGIPSADELEIVKKMEGAYGGFSGAEIECVVNNVIEKKFIEYMNDKSSHNTDENYTPQPRKITKKDFEIEVTKIKPSVMAEQKSKILKKEDFSREKTNIEKIIDMQRTYRFKPATDGNDV